MFKVSFLVSSMPHFSCETPVKDLYVWISQNALSASLTACVDLPLPLFTQTQVSGRTKTFLCISLQGWGGSPGPGIQVRLTLPPDPQNYQSSSKEEKRYWQVETLTPSAHGLFILSCSASAMSRGWGPYLVTLTPATDYNWKIAEYTKLTAHFNLFGH